jgi:hypothetical protein
MGSIFYIMQQMFVWGIFLETLCISIGVLCKAVAWLESELNSLGSV